MHADVVGAPPVRGRVVDGRAVAAKLRGRVAEEVRALAARRVVPGLTVVLVGDDPASGVYVAAKAKACAEVGMRSDTIRLSRTSSRVSTEARRRVSMLPPVMTRPHFLPRNRSG